MSTTLDVMSSYLQIKKLWISTNCKLYLTLSITFSQNCQVWNYFPMDRCFALILTLAKSHVPVIIKNALVSTVITLNGWLFKKNCMHFLPFESTETSQMQSWIWAGLLHGDFLLDRTIANCTWSILNLHSIFSGWSIYSSSYKYFSLWFLILSSDVKLWKGLILLILFFFKQSINKSAENKRYHQEL